MLPPQRISDLEASSRDASSEVADLRRQLADYESLTKQLQEFTEDLQKKEKANQAKEKALKKDVECAAMAWRNGCFSCDEIPHATCLT